MEDVDRRAGIMERLTQPDGPFPVERARIRGVDLRVYAETPGSIRDVLVTGRQWGERPALTFEDEHYTWSEYLRLVGRFASTLVEGYGIRPGDRVAIAARNYPEWAVAFSATVSVGAVCVPLNAWWTAPELANALADCAAAAVVADAERSASIQRERHRLPALRRVVEVRPAPEPSGDDTWDAVLDAHREEFDLAAIPIAAEDDATIMYTSGTTGKPKGAVASHRAHLTTMMNMRVHARVESELAQLRGEPVRVPPVVPTALIVGPLFHVATLPRIISAAASGAHLVLMYKWDARRAVELIRREGVDLVPGGVPPVLSALLTEVERTGADLPSLRSITSGGAPATSVLVARIVETFDHRVTVGTGYGLTETSGPMVMIGSHDFVQRPLSVGRAFPTTDLRIVDADGNDVETGQVGEAWLRGPNAAYRYWNHETEALDAAGWFRSGDLARVDEQGFVYLVDRIKDVVLRSGENVYCTEVEDVLSVHPDVEDSAVFGRPHDVLGEEVVAVVRTRPGSITTAADLRRHVGRQLAAYKVPAELYLQTDDFPRNAVGKVLKRELRARLARRGEETTWTSR
ncbi:class I adenylate-forming enzyme family protein [Cryptosporangium sp. NPDC051539]|uniref:class I adenylate-forming enzyme family protein n=1 Tax=Cryptosporangium sp. NPDC051539 TaxID=3363962 RepID=UPI00378EE78C